MTRVHQLVALAALLGACGSDAPAPEDEPPGPPEGFSVMSFNVLCSFCGADMYDSWDERLVYFEDIFERYDPDLLGLQELAFAAEVDQLLALRPGYAAAFFTNPDNNFSYPDATVLYREERFELVDSGEYWLSPTPEVPSSTGFAETQLPRLVQWVELRDKASRRALYFASTHFDNNAPSQEKSAPLLLERTAPWIDEMPAVVLGDFNSQPADVAYQTLTSELVNAQDLAEVSDVEHNQPTAPAYDYDARIDHIFVAPDGWTVARWAADLWVYGAMDRYPSDHFAIYAELTAPEM